MHYYNFLFKNMRRTFLSIIYFIFVHLSALIADQETPTIEFFSYKDGLTTSNVYSVLKDSKGFVWICTENGLYRFDGYNFRNLSSIVKASINGTVNCITEDKDQNLWFGTSGFGVYMLQNNTGRLYQLNLQLEKDESINQILFIKDKILLASNSGVLVIDKNIDFDNEKPLEYKRLLPFAKYKSFQDNVINCFYTGSNEKVWVGTNAQLYLLNTINWEFTRINSFPQNSIRSLSAFENKVLAGSWDGGIFAIDTITLNKSNNELINYANTVIGNKRVMTAFTDKNKSLYIATYGHGLFIFKQKDNKYSYQNFKNDKNIPENIKSNVINQMYLDDSGILWLSMNQPALTKIFYQDDIISYYSPEENKQTIEFSSINQSIDKNKLWVATNGKGIYLFNTETKTFVNTNSRLKLLNNDITSGFQDSRGNLWIVYRRNGLYMVPGQKAKELLNNTTGSVIHPIDANSLLAPDSRYNSYITKFYEDSKGRIWIGLWGSMFIINTNEQFQYAKNTTELKANSKVINVYSTEKKSDLALPILPVLAIQEVAENEFWLGTRGAGIISFQEGPDGKFSGKLLELNNELPKLNVRSIFKDRNSGIWIGTNGGMCYLKNRESKLKIFRKNDGLSSEDINNIIEDKNSNIWASSNYGVMKFRPADLSFHNFIVNKREELNQYSLNSACLDNNGTVWFLVIDALASLDPEQRPDQKADRSLYFTDIKIDNKTVSPGYKIDGTMIIDKDINACNKIYVPYNHTLSLEFAELNYKSPEQVLYKYKLGKSKDWIILNSRQRNIPFSSMSPGEYQLEVMSVNSKNNENVKRLDIHFLPPYWQSKTAMFIYFIVILILFLIYRRFTIQKVLQKNETEKERYERKKLEELDKLKSEFFSNISHEFRTPLSLIINPLEKLVNDDELSIKNKEKIDLVLKSSNRLLKLTNELMDFSKIEKNSLVPYYQDTEFISFTYHIFELFQNIAEANKIDYRYNNNVDQLFVATDRNMTEKIIFNLLSNAFKYTPKNGIILLEISVSNEFVVVSIINSGDGIASENIKNIFDRYYQVNNVQNRSIEGTGIGLALVKNYVELQHGRVEVISNQGTDTTFSVYLPLKQEKSNADETTLPQFDNINEETKVSLKDIKLKSQYHILVVEDEDDLRNFIVSELQSDFKVTSALNGEEGIKLANELIPDLIITDVMMPVLSGIDLCNTIKNQMGTSHIPIIILSAKTKVSEQIEGLEMGADVYMLKPFNMEHLKVQIVRLINFKEKIYSRFLGEKEVIPQGAFTSKLDEEFMNKITSFLDVNLSDSNLGVDQLANCVTLSKVQTYRKVKAITGLTVVEFIRAIRLKKAAQLVLDRKLSFSEIAYETGFSSPSYFTRCFHEHFGKTPSEYVNEFSRKETGS